MDENRETTTLVAGFDVGAMFSDMDNLGHKGLQLWLGTKYI